MNEIKSCGIILCSVIICIIFKSIKQEYALLVRLFVTVTAFVLSLTLLYPVFSYINEIASGTQIEAYIPILFKALGIAFCVEITSDICKDAQESSLAERICFIGKAEILIISLPLVKELVKLSQTVME